MITDFRHSFLAIATGTTTGFTGAYANFNVEGWMLLLLAQALALCFGVLMRIAGHERTKGVDPDKMEMEHRWAWMELGGLFIVSVALSATIAQENPLLSILIALIIGKVGSRVVDWLEKRIFGGNGITLTEPAAEEDEEEEEN
jgi:hypothetical protein